MSGHKKEIAHLTTCTRMWLCSLAGGDVSLSKSNHSINYNRLTNHVSKICSSMLQLLIHKINKLMFTNDYCMIIFL